MSIILSTDERRQWEAAVAAWPVCQTCGGKGQLLGGNGTSTGYEARWLPCPDCAAGRVPQSIYIVIEGEPHEHDGNTSGCQIRPGVWQCATDTCTGSFHDDDFHEYGLVVPARWRVPVGEPCEIRALDPAYYSPPNFNTVLLASAATVEVLPVVERASVDWSATPMVTVNTPTGVVRRWWDESGSYKELTLDPLPEPGKHWVAVIQP